MPDENTLVPGAGDPGQPPTQTPGLAPSPRMVGPAEPAPVTSTDDWQKRFTGLQSALNEALTRTGWKSLKDVPPATQVAEWQQAAGTLSSLQQEKQALATDFELQTAQLTGLKAEHQKLTLLAAKHPELMGFHQYIPTAADEAAQEDAIAAFQATLGNFAKSVPAGAPPPPAGGYPAGGADLKAEVNQARATWENAVMSGKPTAEIEGARQKYFQLDASFRKQNGLPDPFAAPRARDIG